MMPTPRDGRKTLGNGRVMEFPSISNDAVIAAYIAHRAATRWVEATVRVRTNQLRIVAEQLAPTLLTQATEEDLIRWFDARQGRPETRASYLSAVHGLYRWMTVTARPRIRLDDPTLILERPRIPAAQPRPMPDRHYDLALACAVSNPEMYLWLGLMGCCGLRCCEVAWLQTADVEQLEVGGLLHLTGKGGKQRTVPVGEMLLCTLTPFLRTRGPVFTRPSDGKAHTPNRVSQLVGDFLADVGVPAPNRAHSIRHRFGTDYHAIDADLYRQAELMGHGSVDTTRLYTQIHPLDAARYIEQLTERRLRPGRRPGPDPGRRAA